MRKSEITKELIQLSRKAKWLGFPQDVEEGDWFACDRNFPYREDLILYGDDTCHPDDFPVSWLILSFSHCLGWLREQKWRLVGWNDPWPNDEDQTIEIEIMKSPDGSIWENAKTHHEAIAKCVCKILEEGDE